MLAYQKRLCSASKFHNSKKIPSSVRLINHHMYLYTLNHCLHCRLYRPCTVYLPVPQPVTGSGRHDHHGGRQGEVCNDSMSRAGSARGVQLKARF